MIVKSIQIPKGLPKRENQGHFMLTTSDFYMELRILDWV